MWVWFSLGAPFCWPHAELSPSLINNKSLQKTLSSFQNFNHCPCFILKFTLKIKIYSMPICIHTHIDTCIIATKYVSYSATAFKKWCKCYSSLLDLIKMGCRFWIAKKRAGFCATKVLKELCLRLELTKTGWLDFGAYQME